MFCGEYVNFFFREFFHVEETPKALIWKDLKLHGMYSSALDTDNIITVGNKCLFTATDQPKWFLIQAEKNISLGCSPFCTHQEYGKQMLC